MIEASAFSSQLLLTWLAMEKREKSLALKSFVLSLFIFFIRRGVFKVTQYKRGKKMEERIRSKPILDFDWRLVFCSLSGVCMNDEKNDS